MNNSHLETAKTKKLWQTIKDCSFQPWKFINWVHISKNAIFNEQKNINMNRKYICMYVCPLNLTKKAMTNCQGQQFAVFKEEFTF